MRLKNIFINKMIVEADALENDVPAETDKVGEDQGDIATIWDEGAEGASSFRPKSIYDVKQIGDEYEVSLVTNNTRKVVEKVTKDELDQKYLISGAGEPGVEGYVTYTLNDVIEAFQYNGASRLVSNGSEHTSLIKGDYIVKRSKKTSFELMIVHQTEFESKYEEMV